MRSLLFLFLILFNYKAISQTYAMIKMNSVQPVKFVDLITNKDIRDGRFPIEMKYSDSIISELNEVKQKIDSAKDIPLEAFFEYKTGSFTIKCTSKPMAYGVRINASITSIINGKTYTKYLCRSSLSNAENSKRIQKLINLLHKK